MLQQDPAEGHRAGHLLRALEHERKSAPKVIDIAENKWFRMALNLPLDGHLPQLFPGTWATGQHDKGAHPFAKPSLAIAHGVGNAQLAIKAAGEQSLDPQNGEGLPLQHATAGGEGAIGGGTHATIWHPAPLRRSNLCGNGGPRQN